MVVAPRAGSRLRSAALLVLGALALHELRYLLAYGAQADSAEAAVGHGYLQLLTPILIAVMGAAILVSVIAPAIRRRLPAVADSACVTERAAAYAVALLALFAFQEIAETLLSGSTAGALDGLTGPGGWLALPLAIFLGALAAAAGHGLDRAEHRVALAFGAETSLPRAPRRLAHRPAPDMVLPCSQPMAFGICRRPPPLPAV